MSTSSVRENQRPRIVFMVEGKTACSEIVLEPFEELNRLGEIELIVAYECDYAGWKLRRLVRDCDLLFAFRSCTPRAAKACAAAKKAGVTLVYSSDDDLLALDSSNPAGQRHEKPAIQNATESMIQSSDWLWFYSDLMKSRYERFNIPIVTTRVTAPVTALTLESLQESIATDRTTLTIGHIGDYSHAPEMEPLVEVVHQLTDMNLNIDWCFDFVGYTPEALVNHPRVRTVDYIRGIENFYRWLSDANWDIGIAPLRQTLFNECKTDNKFRTFAAFGIAGIYTNISPYTDSIEHGKDGLLVDHSSNAYTQAILSLIADPQLRNQIRRHAFESCRNKYSWQAVLTEYRRSLQNILSRREAVAPPNASAA